VSFGLLEGAAHDRSSETIGRSRATNWVCLAAFASPSGETAVWIRPDLPCNLLIYENISVNFHLPEQSNIKFGRFLSYLKAAIEFREVYQGN
jgi:hypothetical protein